MKWLKYIVAILLAALGVIAYLASRDEELPDVRTELKAIDAEAEIQKLEIEMGRQKALEVVQATYAEQLKNLDETKKAQAEELKKKPAKLARFLLRAAR